MSFLRRGLSAFLPGGSPSSNMDYLSSLLYDERGGPIAEPFGVYATPIREAERIISDLNWKSWSDLPAAIAGAGRVPFKVGPFQRPVALPLKPKLVYDCPYCSFTGVSKSALESHISHIHPVQYKESEMREEISREMIDLNSDGKINTFDVALAARYGGVGEAVKKVGAGVSPAGVIGEGEKEHSELIRATDIPGQASTDELDVVGDDVDFIQRGGFPREMEAVYGYPEPVVYEGDNMAFYPRYQRRWMVVPPGTPGAIPSRFRPGQWVIRVR